MNNVSSEKNWLTQESRDFCPNSDGIEMVYEIAIY